LLDRSTWTGRRILLWAAIVAALMLLPVVIKNG